MARYESTLRHLVLLPGLDGTGGLFDDFVEALPKELVTTVVRFPPDRFLPYTQLVPFVVDAAPRSERFVLLAESYSTPLALKYAATNPRNLAGLIISAGFVSPPLGGWSSFVRVAVGIWPFGVRLPKAALRYFLLRNSCSQGLVDRVMQNLELVGSQTVIGRVREVLACDARGDLAGTKMPILYIQALSDRLLSSTCLKEVFRAKPDVAVATIEAPHLLLQQEPVKAAELVTEFLASCK